jgi:hypothetical protein
VATVLFQLVCCGSSQDRVNNQFPLHQFLNNETTQNLERDVAFGLTTRICRFAELRFYFLIFGAIKSLFYGRRRVPLEMPFKSGERKMEFFFPGPKRIFIFFQKKKQLKRQMQIIRARLNILI